MNFSMTENILTIRKYEKNELLSTPFEISSPARLPQGSPATGRLIVSLILRTILSTIRIIELNRKFSSCTQDIESNIQKKSSVL